MWCEAYSEICKYLLLLCAIRRVFLTALHWSAAQCVELNVSCPCSDDTESGMARDVECTAETMRQQACVGAVSSFASFVFAGSSGSFVSCTLAAVMHSASPILARIVTAE